MSEPLYVTLMWHMHQPYYRDPLSGEYVLPWTYLHAIKDYYDMAAIVDTTPGIKVVFNLVPSLLEQIRDYASGEAMDPFLLRGKMRPADMNEEDRIFILKNFFAANRQRMIEPNKRYLELLYLAGDGEGSRLHEHLPQFGDQEILDLQVWFFLAWTGEAARRRYPELQQLVKKGKNFSQEDKDILFSAHNRLLREIIPLYRHLHATGKAELSCSPYFHPILPLLCDMRSALVAMPRANLPAAKFSHPEDARGQVAHGIACFQENFGFTPAGIWPSEGSVSDGALAILANAGVRWTASDEDVLARSINTLEENRKHLYRPYDFSSGSKKITLFFRDHILSDRIGFTYSQWQASRAVSDFVDSLKQIEETTVTSRKRHISIILDGENAWEYYPNNGYDFLTMLYKTLATTPELQTVTFSEALERLPERGRLHHVHPGSWINASYGIWVGHPEENLAWDYLERARDAAVRNSPEAAGILATGEFGRDKNAPTAQVARALYAAEGSDWFWWFGDDHFSPHSNNFDRLFRKNLMYVYRTLGLDIPRELYEPIKKVSPAGLVREPAATITPTINGQVDGYFEWLAAGLYDLSKQSSAMHAAENLLYSFHFGYDRHAFYFRLDGASALDKVLRDEDLINLHIIVDREYLVTVNPTAEKGPLFVRRNGSWQETGSASTWKISRIAEIMVPLVSLKPEKNSNIFVYITLVRNNQEIGRWPTDAPMLLKYSGPELEQDNWLI